MKQEKLDRKQYIFNCCNQIIKVLNWDTIMMILNDVLTFSNLEDNLINKKV